MWCLVGAKLGMRAVPMVGHLWGRKVMGGEGFMQREVSLASGGLCSLGLPHHDAG